MALLFVVSREKMPRIYETWQECSDQVIGFHGSMFKRYASINEAREALRRFMRDHATDAGDTNQRVVGNALLYGGKGPVIERSGVLSWVLLTLLVLDIGLRNAIENA